MSERVGLTLKKPEVNRDNSDSRMRRTYHSQSVNPSVDRILFLQRTVGNQAVQRLLRSGALQAKLRIGEPGDVYEQEADRVADAVMRMPEPEMQRQVGPEEEEEEILQTKPLVDQITPVVQRQVEEEEELVQPKLKTNAEYPVHRQEKVQRVVVGIQAKLVVGQPGDVYEQEADRVADAVMRMPEPGVQRQVEPEEEEEEILQTKPLVDQFTPLVQVQRQEEPEEEEEMLQAKPLAEEITPLVQRQLETEEEEEEEMLQAKSREDATSEVSYGIESQINAIKGGGQPLAESERSFFEPRFGSDFSQVRVHTDTKAAEAARAVNARAYTLENNIVFGEGQYNPQTNSGKRLLAHELTHVVQQKADSEFIENFSIQQSNSPHSTSAAGSISRQASSVQRQNIENCSFRQFALVLMGIGDARRLVNEALRAISGNQSQIQNKAQIHFGQPLGASEYQTIIQRYRHILTTLNSKTYICDDCTSSSFIDLGIGLPNPGHLPCALGECRGSRIIICPPFDLPPNCPPAGQTIVHEAAHNSGACLDIARRPGQYPPAPSDGINNAYSYEYFAVDVSP